MENITNNNKEEELFKVKSIDSMVNLKLILEENISKNPRTINL